MRQINLEKTNLNYVLKQKIKKKAVIENIRADLYKIVQITDAKAGLFTLYSELEHKYLPELFLDQSNNLISHSLNGSPEPFSHFLTYKIIKDITKIPKIFNDVVASYEISTLFYFPILIKEIKEGAKVGEVILFLRNTNIPAKGVKLLKSHLGNLLLTSRTYYDHEIMVMRTKQLATIIDFTNRIEKAGKKEDILKAIELVGVKGYKKIYNTNPGFLIRIRKGDELVAYKPENKLHFVPKSISINEPLFKDVLDSKHSVVINNPKNNPNFRRLIKTSKANKEYNQFLASLNSIIITPFLIDDYPRGVFIIYEKARLSGLSEKLFFDNLASVFSLTYKNLETYERAEKRLKGNVNRLTLLHRLTKNIISESDMKKLLNTILKSGMKIGMAKSGNISIINREKNILEKVVVSKDPLDGNISTMPLGQGICGKVMESGKAMNVNDAYELDYWKKILIEHKGKEKFEQLIGKGKLMRSEISAPLKVRNEIIGTIDAHKIEVGGFSDDDLEIFKDLANLSAIVIKRQELQERLDMVREIADHYSGISNIDLSKELSGFLKKSLDVIKVPKGAIALVKTIEGKEKLSFVAVEGINGLKKGYCREIGNGIMGIAAENLITMNVDDVSKYVNHIEVDKTIKSECVVPLIFDRKLKGILMAASTVPKRFSNAEKELLRTIGNQISILTHNIQLIEEKEEHYRIMQKETIQHMMNLSGMMAHQINNPLTSIQIEASILEDKLSIGNTNIHDNINAIMRAINSASQIIDKIRIFTLKAGTEFSAYNIHNLLDETVDFIKGIRIKEKHIKVIRSYDKNIDILIFDRFQMTQVFLNLINNAYDAMREKGGCLSIATKKVNDEVEICFEDDGIGIPKANKARIFDSFYTTKSEGAGLGLPISKRMIENHDGKITFKSREGIGTKFIIKLPLTGKK